MTTSAPERSPAAPASSPAALPEEVLSGEGLLRAEVFSAEQLARHARDLAGWHRLDPGAGGNPLLARLDGNESVLREVFAGLRRTRPALPAAEWLLDNHHLVLEQIAIARRHLPRRYSRQLPRLTTGDPAGAPRVYAISLELIAHADGRVDEDSLTIFIRAYQERSPLTLGELWAVPIMLRLALIENLRRVAARVDRLERQRALAAAWAERLGRTADENPSSLVIVIGELAREAALTPAFVSELHRRVQGLNPQVALVIQWLDQRLAEHHQTAAELVRIDHQAQAADQLAVEHAITSLRRMGAIDWRAFVAALSPVEAALAADPDGAYAQMDFATRDRYRQAVEELARRCRGGGRGEAACERAVAEAAVDCARGASGVERHVGWWLIDAGRVDLERRLARELGLRRPRRRPPRPLPLAWYLGPIALIALGLAGLVAAAGHPWLAALALLPASQAAVALANWAATRLARPHRLPRLDFSRDGIPPSDAAVVAVPAMLRAPEDAEALAEGLLVRALANREQHLRFALLTDLADAPERELPGDAALVAAAAAAIGRLNAEHGPRFVLLHRARRWNLGEGAWMGYERKRGKLEDLNRLILEGDASAFAAIAGDAAALRGMRHVIVCDTDTGLPRDAARELVAAMAHPLNRPRLSGGRVVGGHALLQPRTAIGLGSARRSWFASLRSGDAGIDPYTLAVSDVYQDLFGAGSFIGKGIYDVAAFAAAVGKRFPPNAILSHDLIEGCYARSALASDVLMVEDHPARYLADVARRRRWIRGDWQLLPWLGRRPDRLDVLSQWKLIDNLRRSLLAPAEVALLAAAWCTAPAGVAAALSIGVAATHLLPAVLGLAGLLRIDRESPWRVRVRQAALGLGRASANGAGELAMLPFEAAVAADAILRTLWRLLVSRRHLLEWQTSSEAERLSSTRLADVTRAMLAAPAAGCIATAIAAIRPEIAAAALPFAALWLAAPLAAWLASRPRSDRRGRLSAADRRYLAACARRTWQHFAERTTAEDRWLPPDNVQAEPVHAVAHRTSPTNIGLALLAELAAYDLGWQTLGALAERIERTWRSVAELERFHGHLLNWYDTRTGAPLAPRYVSSVDSGNLAGHLLVLAAGLRELARPGAEDPRRWRGIAATVACAGTPEALALAAELREDGGDAAAWRDRLAAAAAAAPDEIARLWLARASVECAARAAEEAVPPAGIGLRLEALAAAATELALGMDWRLLYDQRSKLFAIGYQVDEARLDRSSYDLLASESRLGSYVAVAAGGIPQEHWFHLGRRLVRTARGHALVSWSGTLFEYLMPALVMPEEPGTLLDESNRGAVAEQIRYAGVRGVPWGISESAYYLTDAALNWQYRAFGVPGLGLKRGLGDDVVVAPYATALALLVDAPAAVANLRRLEGYGALGQHGFCEAIDFTSGRLPVGAAHAVIRSWMAHHQAMALLAFLHVLAGAPMRRRFLADPRLLAHRLLLQERPVPAVDADGESPPAASETPAPAEPGLRIIAQPHPPTPEFHLLSNGRYHLAISAAGAGGAQWHGIALTRWRPDPTCDADGPAIYLRDLDDDRCWSAAHHPMGVHADRYEAVFSQAKAEFRRSDGDLSAHTEIAISPEDDVELRRLTITNRGDRPRRLELTTCAEPVLAPAAADLAHRSFSSLFIETEAAPEAEALLASRRPRRPDEPQRWLVHVLAVRDGADGPLSWETDRARFLGRGGRPSRPALLLAPLTGATGAVIDPILALRRRIAVPPGGHVAIDVIYAVADGRAAALALAGRYRDRHLADRAFGLAQTHGAVVLAQLGANEHEAQIFGRLAGALIQPTAYRRSPAAAILRNRRTRSGLWSHGISGDLPICLLRVTDGKRIEGIRQMLRAHAWWRSRGLAADLVLLIEDPSVYRQELTDRVLGLVAAGPAAGLVDRPGGVFIRRLDQVPEEDRHLLHAVARMVIVDAGGTLAQYAERRLRPEAPPPRLIPPRPPRRDDRRDEPVPPPAYDLLAWNGLGGFTRDGREYIIVLPPGAATPLPWCNVLANAHFGSVVSERGAGYTWAVNCHEYRLTPWRCDPVGDPHGEALFLRDEDSGIAWSATPGPFDGRSTRVVRHGFGYCALMAGEEAIASELHTWVDAELPVKHLRLRLANRSPRPRRLTALFYVEWTLGELRERTAAHLVTEHEDGALYARNPLHDEESQRCAFIAASRQPIGWTCDRGEFLGRGGCLGRPAALRAARLLERAGPLFDPCAALHVAIDLEPGEEQEVVFCLGAGRDRDDARSLALGRRGLEPARASLMRVYEHWKRVLGGVQVRTGDESLDLLANGWLAYQAIAARILARSGYSQSGGAWGFRDQLQDAMALVHHAPHLLREQIVRCAGRQFREGDVQHWWHPPGGRGVRTRISDDYLWLPYALCRYLDATGDRSVLDERAPFLAGPALPPDRESLYDLPAIAEETGTVYEHAARAILHGLRFGPHGLPLIGTGDWNDGMDRIGHHGRGESVWLGFFLADALRRFAPVARAAGDAGLADRLAGEAEMLAKRIDVHAWEGDRYLRAWTDDGVAVGSAGAAECRIDTLPQAWAALTGLCSPARARAALESVRRLLVRPADGLILLFDPPFDRGPIEPGYIKGYVPGVRENGGQYTHAAVWTAMAFAAIGDGGTALELARLIDPVRRAADPGRWMGEPYVLAADVYRTPMHTGRAGWTWYTGSAGWMLRLILESLVGLVREGDHLRLAPALAGGELAVDYRHGGALYRIRIRGDGPVRRVAVDAHAEDGDRFRLADDGREHEVVADRWR